MSTGTEHRKLAAIMFTDMVGYSALAQSNEALALELLEEHRRIVRGILPQHAGREVKTTGDGFLVEFPSALAAAQCAVEIQRTLAERNQGQPAERQVRIRIGIHVGDVVAREGDVHGDGVNIAARIEPLAEPGGICLSRAVFEQVQGKLAEPMESAGEVDLKNLTRPVEVFRVELRSSQEDLTRESQIANHKSQMERSLAVLPFVNMSDDRENEFLADGITEDLITALSRVKGLRVPARTSSFAFKGKNEDIRRIGQLLNVETVLEGSVRKAGNKLRVTAQLIKVRDGFHLWSERYDREMKDVFDIQDDITRAIVGALEVQLGGGPQTQFVQRQTTSTLAYELYAQGRIHCSQRGIGLLKALHYFELALLEDPTYALALAGLSESLGMSAFYELARPRDVMPRAVAVTEKLVQVAPELADGHAMLGWLNMCHHWDWPASERCFRRAIECNPKHAPAHFWYAGLMGLLGRGDESLASAGRAVELDPLSPGHNIAVVWWSVYARRISEATEKAQRVIARWPEVGLGYVIFADCLMLQGRAREAVRVAEQGAELSHRSPMSLGRLGIALVRAGECERARAVLAELLQPRAPWQVCFHDAAIVQWHLGEKAAAGASIQRAFEEREPVLPFHFAFPLNDELRGDPVFEEVRRKLGLSP